MESRRCAGECTVTYIFYEICRYGTCEEEAGTSIARSLLRVRGARPAAKACLLRRKSWPQQMDEAVEYFTTLTTTGPAGNSKSHGEFKAQGSSGKVKQTFHLKEKECSQLPLSR